MRLGETYIRVTSPSNRTTQDSAYAARQKRVIIFLMQQLNSRLLARVDQLYRHNKVCKYTHEK
jgi:hypothetical protein